MRKIGLLAVLTVVGMLSFSAVAMATPTPDPTSTDPAAQAYETNGTGVGTEGISGFSGQAYRMNSDGTAGPAGTPDASGNNGTSWNSPTVSNLQAPGAIKYDSPNNQKIHSSYSKTSDACASCHAVHTAVGQGNLLQWEDPQTACWACHDGTVAATYNVVTGTHSADGVEKVSSAGLFGTGLGSEAGLSNHGMSPKDISTFVTTSAAPGGAENAGTDAVPGVSKAVPYKDKNGNWSTEFSCIACHDPHGTFGNARILSPDPNGIQTAYRTALGTGEVVTSTDGITYTAKQGGWLSGHGVDPVVIVQDDPINYPHDATKKLDKPSAILANQHVVAQGEANNFHVDFKAGKIVFDVGVAPAAGSKVYIQYTPGLVVDMTVSNKLTQTETVVYKSGINQFCGACHTDYNNVNKVPVWKTTDGKDTTITGNNGILVVPQVQATNADGTLKFKTGGAYNELLGEYRLAYRHSVGFTRTGTFVAGTSLAVDYPGLKFDLSAKDSSGNPVMTVDCLTCHYAHGTSDAFIQTSLSQDGITAFDGNNSVGDPLLATADPSRTTALKRLPNMGVCQQCHNKQGAAPDNTLEPNGVH
ncbi:cytochrome c3 family protein [Desulfitobacterium sp.]|uniref:cytochrome c3 family protein n=1 Tax=Desulfitobacterium sp. TaxID=49981 RepID=UPI002B53680B|nr:cytochrome c3 family protein [Desulfitobacterium sp.]HVJ48058.1 cytochrome c3 family protein [Desulfitobacterium sp.]